MALTVYVCAPYEDAAIVHALIHTRIEELGLAWTSRWAAHSRGPEDFASLTPDALRAAAEENDRDVMSADVVLVMARKGAGGEMFAEARFALEHGKALVWTGRRTLSAWRRGVVRCEEVKEALNVLAAMKVHHARGARGELLAQMSGGAA